MAVGILRSLSKRANLIVTAESCNLITLTAGMFLSWTSPVLPKINNGNMLDDNPFGEAISSEQESWIASLFSVGSIFGPLLAGILVNRIGRKLSLLFAAAIPLIIVYIVLAFAKTIVLYYICRFIGGFSFGVVTSVAPLFLGEISEPAIRGIVLCTFSLHIGAGGLLSDAIGPFLSVKNFCIISAVIPTVAFVTFFCCNESPYYYIAKNSLEDSRQSLMKLRKAKYDEVESEFLEIKENVENEMKNKGSLLDVFENSGLRKALIICLGIIFLQQWAGMNLIVFYMTNIFEASGTSLDSNLCTIIVGLVQFLSTVLTPFVVENWGRKTLLIISSAGAFITELALGAYFYLLENQYNVESVNWLPLINMIIFVIFFSFGLGTIPFTIIGEIFPADVKTAASTTVASFSGLMGFSMSKSFVYLNNAIGMGPSYWILSGVCFVSIFFCKFFLIETKGKKFAEIQKILNQ